MIREQLARFTDDEEDEEDDQDSDGGGGFGSRIVGGARSLADPNESADWVPGVEEARESDQFQERQEEYNEADGALGKFDAAVAAGSDFLLDNPEGSVQETSRSGIEYATGLDDEEQAEKAQDIDEGVTSGIDSAIEGTALDNRGTDAVRKAGDVFLGDLVRTGVGAATGIDSEDGDTEARTGAVELADIGLTLGTAGTGRAGMAAFRASDDVGGLAGRLLGRGGDEAAETAVKGTDEVTEAATEAADEGGSLVRRTADEVLGGSSGDEVLMTAGSDGTFSTARASEDVARAADEAARGADEAALKGDQSVAALTGRTADEGGSLADRIGAFRSRVAGGADEATSTAARTFDEATSTATRAADDVRGMIRGTARSAARSADEAASTAARTADDVSSAAGRAGARAGRAARNRPITTAAVGGAGAVVAGGAVHQTLFGGADEVELRDESGETFRILRDKTYEPTRERPNGGILWRVEQGGSIQGYTVVLSVEGNQVNLLGADGEEMVSTLAADEMQQAAARGQEQREANSQGANA